MKKERVEVIAWTTFGVWGTILFVLILFCFHRCIPSYTNNKQKQQQDHEEEEEEEEEEGGGGGGGGEEEETSKKHHRFHISLWKNKNKNKSRKRDNIGSPQFELDNLNLNLREMTVGELEAATSGFSQGNLLKAGHSGTIYTGTLKGEVVGEEEEGVVVMVVVKRFSPPQIVYWAREGRTQEVDLFEVERENYHKVLAGSAAGVAHGYVLPILGFCREGLERMLVYPFMPNRDLATTLAYARSSSSPSYSLPWTTRLDVARGVAKALAFFHHQCRPCLEHRNIEGSSILLGKGFEVKLGSLTEVKTLESGEEPLYDIQCFGKVLLDLLSGLDVSGCVDTFAQAWMLKSFPLIEPNNQKDFLETIDPILITQLDQENVAREIMGVAFVAKACIALETTTNLSMKKVHKMLCHPQKITTLL